MNLFFFDKHWRLKFAMIFWRVIGPLFFVFTVVIVVSYVAAMYVMAAEKRSNTKVCKIEKSFSSRNLRS